MFYKIGLKTSGPFIIIFSDTPDFRYCLLRSDDKNIERPSQETYSALQISFMLCLFLSCYSDLVPYQCLWFTASFLLSRFSRCTEIFTVSGIKLSIRSFDISINTEMIPLLSNKVSCFIYKVWVQYFIPPDYETAWFVDFHDIRKFLFLKILWHVIFQRTNSQRRRISNKKKSELLLSFETNKSFKFLGW